MSRDDIVIERDYCVDKSIKADNQKDIDFWEARTDLADCKLEGYDLAVQEIGKWLDVNVNINHRAEKSLLSDFNKKFGVKKE